MIRGLRISGAALVACAVVGVAAGAGSGSTAPTQVTFAAATSYSAGNTPQTVTVADFNGDGHPDFVVTEAVASLSVRLGRADGTFGADSEYSEGYDNAVAVGDFNGDGRPDMAVVKRGGPVSILLGDGRGGFQAGSDYSVGPNPQSAAVGDFNGDGHADLAVTNNVGALPGSVSILLGDGHGGFGTATGYPTGVDTFSVAVGDFNNDGRLDLAVGNAGSSADPSTVSVLLGNGDGSFGAKTEYPVDASFSSVVGDVNGDGRPDLAVANLDQSSVSVLLGSASGGFGARTDYPTATGHPESVAIGDLNGDGNPDLVVAGDYSNSVSVLLGTGNGSFSPRTDYAAGGDTNSVAIADFNGDGRPDLAVADRLGGVSVLLNTTMADKWSSETPASVFVKPTLTLVKAPDALAFPAIAPSEKSPIVSAPLVVQSNDLFGYQLSVTRTKFSAGDIPLSIEVAPPTGASAAFADPRSIPTGLSSLPLGGRQKAASAAAGDTWGAKFQLGPVGHVVGGTHTATVTFTVVGL